MSALLDCAERDLATSQLEKYEITDRKIGTGSFGSVFEAKLLEDGDIHAVKIIDVRRVSAENTKHLENEIGIMRDANSAFTNGHPNIVRLYCDCRIDSCIYLFMEYCRGGDLGRYIMKRKTLEEKEARYLMCQLKNGLQFLRQHKAVIHRDLKPENLLLTSEDMSTAKLKIADFGLARVLNDGSVASTICGTPLYMAPELVLRGECSDYNDKVDLWSVGAVLFEMVTGRRVFNVKNILELVEAVKSDPNLQYPPGKLSVLCINLIEQLLKVNPEERISYQEFLEHPFLLPAPPQEGRAGYKDADLDGYVSTKIKGDSESASASENWDWDMMDDIVWSEAGDALARLSVGDDSNGNEMSEFDNSGNGKENIQRNPRDKHSASEDLEATSKDSEDGESDSKDEGIGNSTEGLKPMTLECSPVEGSEASSGDRDSHRSKCGISFHKFEVGCRVLFILTNGGNSYIAFHEGDSSHSHYLDLDSMAVLTAQSTRKPAHIVAEIVMIEDCVATHNENPYELPIECKYWKVTATAIQSIDRKPGTPEHELSKLKMKDLKKKAEDLGVVPKGDKRRKQTWISAISKFLEPSSRTRDRQTMTYVADAGVGDIMLFLPMGASGRTNGRFIAFYQGSPMFLSEDSLLPLKDSATNIYPDHILGTVIHVEEKHAEQSNPYGLQEGDFFRFATVTRL